MPRIKAYIIWLLVPVSLIISCRGDGQNMDIIETILSDKESFYYIDFDSYPHHDQVLPIGIFDSGTGGLTVLKSILDHDRFQNETHTSGHDGLRDFLNESFVYFGDLANMPYGNYAGEGKIELLREHIIKDAQFLLGNKYYTDRKDHVANTDKQPVKAIVVGCNTATAYGLEYLKDFISRAGIEMKVIGVINAGAKGALACLNSHEDAVVGVLATCGTVDSKGYENAIKDLIKMLDYQGNIEIFSQGGSGIAEAIDADADYLRENTNHPYKEYKGPGLNDKMGIHRELLDAYNFDFTGGRMLCDHENMEDCSVMQINDAENYMRFHLVSLMEQIRSSNTGTKLKVLILGCTHYPYLTAEILEILRELYDYKTDEGKYLYREYMTQDIHLIDPAENTAKELYEYLTGQSLFNPDGDLMTSEFYISVPNQDNKGVLLDPAGRFPYDYKYGRTAGEIQEYVKAVPFSRDNLSADVLNRIQSQMPYIYSLIQQFHKDNSKTGSIKEKDRI